MARIRTMRKAAAELAEKDPGTSMTITRLRRLVKEGKIRSFDSGKCKLVDLDELECVVGDAAR